MTLHRKLSISALLTLLIVLIGLKSLASEDDIEQDPALQTLTIRQTGYSGDLGWVEQRPASTFQTTIVGIHGTPGSWSAWKALMAAPVIQRRYRFIAVDRPGWGASQATSGYVYPRLKDQARLLMPLLDHLSPLKPVILVAHSWGGPVALKMAADYPDRVSGVVLIASPADPRESAPRWYHKVARARPVQWLIGDSMSRSNLEMLTLHHELANLAPQLTHVYQPVAIIQGGKDWLVTPENAYYLKSTLTEAPVKLDVDPKANHFIPFREPEQVAQAIEWVEAQLRLPLTQRD